MRQAPRWAFDPQELGQTIRLLRRSAGLTQAELAERVGAGRMTISRLEQGESVSVDTALRALSECGHAVVIAPKFARLRIDHDG